jgi:MFS family permease
MHEDIFPHLPHGVRNLGRVPPPRQARLAVSVLFAVNGALFANVVPRLPAVKADLGLSNSSFGAALAFGPVGALLAGTVAGVLVARVGSGRLAALCGGVLGLVLALVGLAPVWAALAGALLVIGALDSVMDVAMNAHGLRVQQAYGRSILNAFHAWWSIGAATGGLTGSAAAALDIDVPLHLAVVGVVLAAASIAAGRFCLPGRDPGAHAHATPPDDTRPMPTHTGWLVVRVLAPLGAFGVLAAIVEDVPSSWGAVYLRDSLGAAAGVAGLGFVAFTAAMTIGRLVNDRLVDRFGLVTVARSGAALAAAGLTGALLADNVTAAIAGFAVVGLGTSSSYPALFAAAGHRPGVRPGDGIAFASWLGRAGFLLAPLLVGVVADAVNLSAGIGVAAVAAALLVLTAGALSPRSRG